MTSGGTAKRKALLLTLLSLAAGASVAVTVKVFAQNDVADQEAQNASQMVVQGRRAFRFDTFGDESFWGDAIKLHLAIEGAKFGGTGPGLSPAAALSLGLKVDIAALPASLVTDLKNGAVDLNDPAVTLSLLQLNSVLGVTGFFQEGSSGLRSVGIQCALCHSLVDKSFSAPGIPPGNVGRRLDGWANRDLNVGAIVALAPDLQPIADVLDVDVATVLSVLQSWGPGKFDAELLLDGQGFRPDGKTAATLIPPAFGLPGVNLHTWTGWGSVTHWNAFVANIEMHGKGRFYDPRLNDAQQFPVAARNGFGNIQASPDEDRITGKLGALHFYQLAIPAPKPNVNSFDSAIKRGESLFMGKAGCNNCHVKPLWTEPGWNLHTPSEVCVDNFQANRAPDRRYRTAPLAGLFTHQKGGFYHDGRFATLAEVVAHYNRCMSLNLQPDETQDLVKFLLTL